MTERILPPALKSMRTFTRRDYMEVMSGYYHMTASQIAYDLQKRLDLGKIIRTGRGEYAEHMEKRLYRYKYSDLANEIAGMINADYCDLDFRIFEMFQLNEFVNHQIAGNTVFVYVENEYVDSVFELLFRKYPGRVMLRPDVDNYYRYWQKDQIIVLRLPSEAPKEREQPWKMKLEQLLVEVLTDKLVSHVIPDEEKYPVVCDVIQNYLIDEHSMYRYARRKGAEHKMHEMITRYGKAGQI